MTSPASNAGLFARLDTVILRVRDLAAAKRWYGKKLGLDIEDLEGNLLRVCHFA